MNKLIPSGQSLPVVLPLVIYSGVPRWKAAIEKVYNYTKAGPMLRRAFSAWTRHVLLPRALPDVDIPQVDDLLEIKDMLTDHSRSWTHQWKMEGLTEGQAALLRNQLTHRFGQLPKSVQQRLNKASSEELETWALNLLDASSLQEVFKH